MGYPENKPCWGRGLLVIFLTYFYFLLFSQFTFLHLLEDAVYAEKSLKTILGAMALSGIAGSFIAVLLRRMARSFYFFSTILFVCSVVAGVSTRVESVAGFTCLAIVMGFAVGVLTVGVAGSLPLLAPSSHRGRIIGLGTGLAYGLSNFPPLFTAPAETRSQVIAVVMFLGALGMAALTKAGIRQNPQREKASARAALWTPIVVFSMIATFMILIWLDSSVFYIIQENRALKDSSWERVSQLYTNAGVHFLAAFVAGWLLDKAKGRMILLLAWLGLGAGATGLQATGSAGFVSAYVVAVSMYSTVLVYIPSLHAKQPADGPSFRRAALLYGISGWTGSALGIGMAENLNRIPLAFVGISFVVILFIAGLSRLLR